MKILGISGSLRKNSLNTAALRACQSLLPNGVTMELFAIDAIPLYNEDVRELGFPASVQMLREKITAADALVFAKMRLTGLQDHPASPSMASRLRCWV